MPLKNHTLQSRNSKATESCRGDLGNRSTVRGDLNSVRYRLLVILFAKNMSRAIRATFSENQNSLRLLSQAVCHTCGLERLVRPVLICPAVEPWTGTGTRGSSPKRCATPAGWDGSLLICPAAEPWAGNGGVINSCRKITFSPVAWRFPPKILGDSPLSFARFSLDSR